MPNASAITASTNLDHEPNDGTPARADATGEPTPPVPKQLQIDGFSSQRWTDLARWVDTSLEAKLRSPRRKSTPEVESFLAELQGTLPTEVPNGTGELTHPVAVAQLAAARLESCGVPLASNQWDAIAEEVERFEAALAQRRENYEARTPRLERILDEIELKEAFVRRFLDSLETAQRQRLLEGAGSEELPAFLSPHRIGNYSERIVSASDRSAYVTLLADSLVNNFSIPPAAAHSVVQCYLREIEPLLTPNPGRPLSPVEQILLAGRAHAHVTELLAATPGVNATKLEDALDNDRWMVPVPAAE